MFTQLRYFAIISLIFVALSAGLASVGFRNVISGDLQALVNKENVTVVQGYSNSIWAIYQGVLGKLFRLPDVERWSDYKEFSQFDAASRGYFRNFSVNEVSVYSKGGKLIFSNKPSSGPLGVPLPEKDKKLFALAAEGKIAGELRVGVHYVDIGGKRLEKSTVVSFLPLFLPALDKSSVAIVKVENDVTPEWKRVIAFQYISVGGVVVIFLLLIAMLIVSSQRAEQIISRQHEANMELMAAAASAEAESQDKSQFLANMSHELRTPLNAIIGFSEIIKTSPDAKLIPQHMDYLRDINSSGVHLLSLINDILDFSKADAGKLEFDIADVDAVKLLKNSMRLVIPRAEQAQVTLIEDLPPKHFVFQTDTKKLKQVLLNLLSNAVKFTPPGGEVRLSVWHDVSVDTIMFQVKDSGIGIAAKDISKVMSPFGQVDSALSRKYEGTGLGLPLSKKFVELLGGKFNLSSVVGKGTTITISLPRIYKQPT